jgi:hypothetical protein
MKQIQLDPYKPKHIECKVAGGPGRFLPLPYCQFGGERITYWKCRSLIGRLLFLWHGRVELKQLTTQLQLPTAVCINKTETGLDKDYIKGFQRK